MSAAPPPPFLFVGVLKDKIIQEETCFSSVTLHDALVSLAWMNMQHPLMGRRFSAHVGVPLDRSQKANLSIYLSAYVPTLTCSHELWVITDEIGFMCRMAGLSLRMGREGARGSRVTTLVWASDPHPHPPGRRTQAQCQDDI